VFDVFGELRGLIGRGAPVNIVNQSNGIFELFAALIEELQRGF
jgi:hypothetical protein